MSRTKYTQSSNINVSQFVVLRALCLAVLMFGWGNLQSQQILSLEEAIQEGLSGQFGIQIAKEQTKIQMANNTWARAGKSPEINLNVGIPQTLSENNSPVSFINGVFYSGNASVSIDLLWNLYNGGRSHATKRQLELQVESSKIREQVEIQSAIRNISRAYYDLAIAQAQLATIQTVFDLSKDRLEYERTKKAFGASSTFLANQLEDAYLSDSIALVGQRNMVRQAEVALNAAMANPKKMSYQVDTKILDEIPVLDQKEIFTQLKSQNLTLKSLLVDRYIAESNVSVQESFLRPQIGLSFGTSAQANYAKLFTEDANGNVRPGVVGNVFTANLGITMTYNLFDGGVIRTNRENAKLQTNVINQGMAQAELNLYYQMENLWITYQNQSELVNAWIQKANLAAQNLEIAKERLNIGSISSFDYRNVQLQFLNAQLSKVNAQYQMKAADLEMRFLAGIL